MKKIKLILILFLSVQIFAAPIVNSCIGMASLTEKTCCPPDDCACDVTDVDIDSSVDALKIDFNFKTPIVFHHITIFDQVLPEYAYSMEVLNLDLPPPLKRDSDILSFYQIYII